MFKIFSSQTRSRLLSVPFLSLTKAVIPKGKFFGLPLGIHWVKRKKNPKLFWEYRKNCKHLWLGKQPVFKKSCFPQRCLSAARTVSLGKGVGAAEGDLFSDSHGMEPHAGLQFICGKWRETVSCVVTYLCYRW